MERRFLRMEQIGFGVCLVLGVLLHFVYEWSGGSPAVALIAPVNESLWEHGKLYTVPVVLWAVVEAVRLKIPVCHLLFAKTAALYTMIFGTFGFYYMYTALLGRNVDWINIASYVLFLAIGCVLSYRLTVSGWGQRWCVAAAFALALLVMLQLRWTTDPPRRDLFRDPRTGTFGLSAVVPGSTIPV